MFEQYIANDYLRSFVLLVALLFVIRVLLFFFDKISLILTKKTKIDLDDKMVTYKPSEAHTTKVKKMNFEKAKNDLNHDPKINPEEGIKRTVKWMKEYYNL